MEFLATVDIEIQHNDILNIVNNAKCANTSNSVGLIESELWGYEKLDFFSRIRWKSAQKSI